LKVDYLFNGFIFLKKHQQYISFTKRDIEKKCSCRISRKSKYFFKSCCV